MIAAIAAVPGPPVNGGGLKISGNGGAEPFDPFSRNKGKKSADIHWIKIVQAPLTRAAWLETSGVELSTPAWPIAANPHEDTDVGTIYGSGTYWNGCVPNGCGSVLPKRVMCRMWNLSVWPRCHECAPDMPLRGH